VQQPSNSNNVLNKVLEQEQADTLKNIKQLLLNERYIKNNETNMNQSCENDSDYDVTCCQWAPA
jgi:transcriptional regulator CtsR